MNLLPLLLAAAIAPPCRAFQFPLTQMQKVRKLVDEGQEQLQRGDYARAIETCESALRLRADYAPAYLCRSEARLKTGDPQARQDAVQALRLDPASGEAYRMLGLYEFESGRTEEALKDFDRALERVKLKPDEVPNVYYYRARSKMKLGDLPGALKDAERGMAVLMGVSGNYFDWSFHSLRAEILRKLGRTAEADKDEQKVLSLLDERLLRRPEESAQLLRMKAESHGLLRDYNAAAQDYARLLAKGEGLPSDRVEHADALLNADKPAEAEKELSLVLSLSPKELKALRLRGYARIRLGRSADALRDLDEILRMAPEDGTTLGYRAMARSDLEDYAGALSDLGRAQALLPAEADALEARKAFVYSKLGRHEDALAAADKALKRRPESIAAHDAVARSASALGRCEQVEAAVAWLLEKTQQSGEPYALRAACRCRDAASDACLADSEKAALFSPDSDTYALDLARRQRSRAESHGTRPDAQALRRCLRSFEKAAALAPLTAQDLSSYLRSISEFAALPGIDALESAGLREKAAELCRQSLKPRRANPEIRRLCADKK
ncbi:MAG: tetratricopeptide repeat protein [Elusimicrobiota bacterium]|jgi:tetratricopeptide (TPR) repeat protein